MLLDAASASFCTAEGQHSQAVSSQRVSARLRRSTGRQRFVAARDTDAGPQFHTRGWARRAVSVRISVAASVFGMASGNVVDAGCRNQGSKISTRAAV